MSYTQGTTHYNLPQTLGDDKRDWFDTNQAFADVDSALYSAETGVQTIDKDLATVKSDLLTAKTDITALKSHNAQTDVKLSALETLTAQHTVEIEDVRNDAEDMVCAINEPTATAQYEHLTGAYFRYNNTLYIATTDINVGDTIVPNVNCSTTDIVTQLVYKELESVSIESNDYFTVSFSRPCFRSGHTCGFLFGLKNTQALSANTTYIVYPSFPKPLVSISQLTMMDNIMVFTSIGVDSAGKAYLTILPISNIGTNKEVQISYTYMCE